MGKLRPQDPQLESDIRAAVERIYRLANADGMTIEKLAKKAKGNFRSFNNWRHGHHVPTLPKLQPFAEAVGHKVRIVVQPAGAALAEPGATLEAMETAEYVNTIRNPALRAQVRDAVIRWVTNMREEQD